MSHSRRIHDRLRAVARDAEWLMADPLLAGICRFGAAIIVAAGPWLVSVIALAIISVTMTPIMGLAAVEDLRLTFVYAFSIAPLAAGPIGAVTARSISAAVEAGEHATIAELFLSSAALSGIVAQIVAIAVILLLGIGPVGVATGFVFLTVSAALLWTSFAVLAAVKSYGFLIAAFTCGMALSVGCALLAAIYAPTTEVLIWCLAAGISFCAALSIRHIQQMFPCRYDRFADTFRQLLRELRANAILCIGVFLAICGVWIDKWVFWFGPDGVRSTAGFLHYSAYDSVMFLSHLSVIPTYAALLVFHHGDLVAVIERFKTVLESRATHAVLRNRIDGLARVAWSGLFNIALVQAAITIGLILMSPLLAKSFDFSFGQFLMMRVGLIGVFFHSLMFICASLLLVANRTRHFAIIQGGFLLLNLGLSLTLYATIGISAYAFFASSLVAAVVAFYAAYKALQAYDYHLFLGENDSLYGR